MSYNDFIITSYNDIFSGFATQTVLLEEEEEEEDEEEEEEMYLPKYQHYNI